MQHCYFVDYDEESHESQVSKLKIELLTPNAPTPQNALVYDDNTILFLEIIVKLSHPITQDLFVRLSTNIEYEINRLQKTSPTLYKASPKIILPHSTAPIRGQLTFGYLNENNEFLQIETHEIWFVSRPY